MESNDTGTAAGLKYAAMGLAATALGGLGSGFAVYEAVRYAGLVGDQGTFTVDHCQTTRSGRTVTTSCWGTTHTRQGDWPTQIDELPASYSAGHTVQVRCTVNDCRQPDTGSTAGCLMGFCITFAVLCAGLIALLKAARAWLGPDFARITRPRLGRWLDKGLVALCIGVFLLFFGSAAVLLTSSF